MIFPSEAWLCALLDEANREPELPRALSGLPRDLAAVVEAEPPALLRTFAAYGRHEGGRLVGLRILEDADEIWELEPAYVVRGPYRVWKALVRGEDPLQAALAGRLKVKGDLQALVRRAGYRYLVERILSRVRTEFPDEGGPS